MQTGKGLCCVSLRVLPKVDYHLGLKKPTMYQLMDSKSATQAAQGTVWQLLIKDEYPLVKTSISLGVRMYLC